MEEEVSKFIKSEYTFEVVYKFMVKHKDFISSNDIMSNCEISKTQFYNALDQLKKLKLIEVKVDMGDLRKKYYRAVRRRDKVF